MRYRPPFRKQTCCFDLRVSDWRRGAALLPLGCPDSSDLDVPADFLQLPATTQRSGLQIYVWMRRELRRGEDGASCSASAAIFKMNRDLKNRRVPLFGCNEAGGTVLRGPHQHPAPDPSWSF